MSSGFFSGMEYAVSLVHKKIDGIAKLTGGPGMKKLIILAIGVILVCAESAYSGPVISTINGVVSHNQTVDISGSGFGSNGLDVEWLGKTIDQSTPGAIFSKSGWNAGQDSDSWNAVRIDGTTKHSGTNSMVAKWDGDPRRYGSTAFFNRGKTIDSIYMTWWVKFQFTGPSGQWKIFRLRPDSYVNDVSPEIYMTSWYSSGMKQAFLRPSSTDSQWISTSSDVSGVLWLGGDDMPRSGEWVRMECYAKGSSQGQKNGTFTYTIQRPGSAIRIPVKYINNLMTYGASQSDRWQYVVLGQYWGNGGEDAKAWYDDVFFQFGSQARVEIGDKSTWDSCTFREIQVPASWDDGSISMSVNSGSFASDQNAFLYVVDASGNVNAQGYPIKIGVGSTDAPTRLRIVSYE